jgi:hypothetical protein
MKIEDLPIVRGVRIDYEQLLSIEHSCDPKLCVGCKCCCSCYDLLIEGNELSRVAGWLPGASRYAPALMDGGEPANVFEELAPGVFSIDTDEDGLCVFAWTDEAGSRLCSLHAAALAEGAEPLGAKPRSCWLWPLALSSSRPPILGRDADVFAFPCNKRRHDFRPVLDAGVTDIIRGLYGEEFLGELSTLLPTLRREL